MAGNPGPQDRIFLIPVDTWPASTAEAVRPVRTIHALN